MKKVCRPFWSYDIQKTENWLSEMAKEGYSLVRFNRWTRFFFFVKGEPAAQSFQIGYSHLKNDSLSKALIEDGWKKEVQSGRWYIAVNGKPPEQLKTFLFRDGIVKRSLRLKYLFSGILVYLSVIAIFIASIFSFDFFQNTPVEVEESPLWFITYSAGGLAIALGFLCIYSVYKLNRLIKSFNRIPDTTEGDEIVSKEREKQLIKIGEILVERKIGWMYSPDRLEKWLEKKEREGFRLYRVSKSGTVFYFKKGKPRQIRYCADYQNISNEHYYEMHRDTGWKSVFMSKSSLQKWTLWSREYSDHEERPQLYSDQSHRLKHARKIVFSYSLLFLPLTIIYLINFSIFISNWSHFGFGGLNAFNTVMYTICIFLFGSFIIRSWLYYGRLKKESKDHVHL
ncbi:DUF2812 domain-containing protein [Bacillus sp. FJAT-42376]|uniref:DUF2812 domain-containing protein n=1 Tax=Bacillus sp. FJAT-42376 TaxID=2014076 RepID=UPI000F507CD1|nr:DUF2812 domain-containing protein [Bacillus sp. FJAT-42376]AZB43140.1 DUF2812 domain-containing protein [Bacillus sp. FJAT-42376]